MFLPIVPSLQHSGIYGALPSMWVGVDAPTGTGYFARVGLGSTYIRKVSSTDIRTYTKVSNTGAATDWVVDGGTNVAKGFIPVPLASIRETTGGTIPSGGGILAGDTTPILATINGDTDGAWRLTWAASNSDLVGFNLLLPPDMDLSKNLLVKFRGAMAGAVDTPVFSLDCYVNEGDTKVEMNSGAITGTGYATYTATIPAAALTGGVTLAIELTLGAHTTNAAYVTAIWLEYTKK